MKLIVDAFGGDNAPEEIVSGVLEGMDEFNEMSVILTGDENILKDLLNGHRELMPRIDIVHAPERISMDEPPVNAIKKKKNSSMVVGLELLKDKSGDGFLTCGSTGATLSGALLRVGRIKGVLRPALAPILPNGGKGVMLIDCGANMDCKPANLEQFAVMGDIYMKSVLRLDSPRIGLANVGTEDEKGNVLTHETFPLLKARTDINFVGNLEGRDVFDKADVIVSDGFAGNLLLKSIEGTASFLMGIIKKEFSSGLRSKMGAGLLMPSLKRIKKMMDYTEYGGAPLLGIDGVIIKGHGSSNAKAVRAAVRQCARMINADVVEIIKERLSAVEI